MPTLRETSPQTVKAMAAALDRVATWYAETAAAESIASGKSDDGQSLDHQGIASMYINEARDLTTKAERLRKHLERRRAEELTPAIDRTEDLTIQITNMGPNGANARVIRTK